MYKCGECGHILSKDEVDDLYPDKWACPDCGRTNWLPRKCNHEKCKYGRSCVYDHIPQEHCFDLLWFEWESEEMLTRA